MCTLMACPVLGGEEDVALLDAGYSISAVLAASVVLPTSGLSNVKMKLQYEDR